MSSPVQEAPHRSWATRLYLGEAGVNVAERRRPWFIAAAVLVAIALAAILIRGFALGMEFTGGNAFHVPVQVGTLQEAEQAVTDAGASISSAQQVGDAVYLIRTHELSADEAAAVKEQVAQRFGITPDQISDELVSAAWGGHVTQRALLGLLVFLLLVVAYLTVRFEPRAAAAAVAGMLLDVVGAAGIYALVGFEVTPATVIGLLTILGFGLYDMVVVLDKIHENTKDIAANSEQTYSEAANLAVNQVLIRSINTSVVALLPVGGLLFIGAGLLGAGTLKDLGLILFVGMAVSFYTSLFFSAPLMVELKMREPRIAAHARRVLTRRTALANREARKAERGKAGGDAEAGAAPDNGTPGKATPVLDQRLIELAGAAPKVGAKPLHARRGGRKRSGGARRR